MICIMHDEKIHLILKRGLLQIHNVNHFYV